MAAGKWAHVSRSADDLGKQARALAEALESWFVANSRDLSWRGTRDPYAIWVSEIMLQQTRVETVERYYGDFLARFPNVGVLAAAEETDVLEAWSGLGYYRRARLLHRGARYVDAQLGGHLPKDATELRKIPGVGPYTAGAIASIAFDQPEPLVDGNVARVLSRIRAVEDPKQQGATAKEHWVWARAIIESGTPRLLAQALMELGATVCTPKRTRCDACPVADSCEAFRQGVVETIPAPRQKIAQPTDTLAAVALVCRDRLALVRRPDTGILASMWCLPMVPRAGRRIAAPGLRELTRTKLEEPRFGSPLKHVFTHRIWDMLPARFELSRRPKLIGIESTDVCWVAPGERPAGGIPSVTQKLLTALGW